MSLQKYFKAKDGLPSPNGSLSNIMTLRAVALANKEVDKVMGEAKKQKNRGPYMKYILT